MSAKKVSSDELTYLPTFQKRLFGFAFSWINVHALESYVGELGFELYVDKENALKLYKILIEEGKNFELSHCGMHAMDIMRMESGFVHWGHDSSPEENQYQAGLKFTIS